MAETFRGLSLPGPQALTRGSRRCSNKVSARLRKTRRVGSNASPRKPPHSIVATYLEHADDGIVPVDAMGRIAVCTGKAASLLDLSSASAVLGRLAGSR